MAEFFPYDNKLYAGEDFRRYTAPRSTGVYSSEDHFAITTSGNQVTIGTGLAWMKFDKLRGGQFSIIEPETLVVPDITGGQIARLFFGTDVFLNTTWVEFRVGQNANDANIQPVRNNMVCELAPYDVTISGGLYSVTDNRMDETLCGIMRDEVTGIPTQMLIDQARAMLDSLQTAYDGIVSREGLMLLQRYDQNEAVAAAGGIAPYVESKIALVPRKNYLINWDFRNPVNQRGQSTYSGGAYSIDRWRPAASSPVTIQSGGILFVPSTNTRMFEYRMDKPERFAGLTMTLSGRGVGDFRMVYNANGTGQQNSEYSVDGEASMTFTLPDPLTSLSLGFTANAGVGATFECVKFEVGEVSTLAGDGPAVYEEELAKCLRYQFECTRFAIPGNNYSAIGSGVVYAPNTVMISIPTPVPLRVAPSIVWNGDLVVSAGNFLTVPVTGIALDLVGGSLVKLNVTVNGVLTPNSACDLYVNNDATARLLLDAEIY